MDKYMLLFVLNVPFVLLGVVRALVMNHEGLVGRFGLALRLLFWGLCLIGLLFSEEIYNYLIRTNLSASSPLSVFDVILTTGFLLSFTLCLRAYAKADTLERRLSDLHEEVSILQSTKK